MYPKAPSPLRSAGALQDGPGGRKKIRWRATPAGEVLDCGGKRSATPLSPGQNLIEKSPLRAAAPSSPPSPPKGEKVPAGRMRGPQPILRKVVMKPFGKARSMPATNLLSPGNLFVAMMSSLLGRFAKAALGEADAPSSLPSPPKGEKVPGGRMRGPHQPSRAGQVSEVKNADVALAPGWLRQTGAGQCETISPWRRRAF